MERKKLWKNKKNRNLGIKNFFIKFENFCNFSYIYYMKKLKKIKKYLVISKHCTIFANEEENKSVEA